MKILLASPVKKPAAIVGAFLASLERLDTDGLDVTFCFADDNDDEASSELLRRFAARHATIFTAVSELAQDGMSRLDHSWSGRKVERIAATKNRMLQLAADRFDYIFLVDADLILQPQTLRTLLNCDRDIVAEIFWTRWHENGEALPQVWLKDHYTLYDAHMLEPRTPEQQAAETARFLDTLRRPGTYRVGGLGACTLIRASVLGSGVNFNPLYNLSFWGEDRSFCIRAAAHDYELYVNTECPAHHVYRMEDLTDNGQWTMDNGQFMFN